jgi:hypothetical protein
MLTERARTRTWFGRAIHGPGEELVIRVVIDDPGGPRGRSRSVTGTIAFRDPMTREYIPAGDCSGRLRRKSMRLRTTSGLRLTGRFKPARRFRGDITFLEGTADELTSRLELRER